MTLLLLAACRLAAAPPAPALTFVEAAPPMLGPAPVVVAIHGLGDVPENLLALVQRCGLPVRVVAPRAPNRHGQGFSWFDVRFDDDGAQVRAEQIGDAADQVAQLLAALADRDDVVGKPIVTGFSQGGFLAFAVATRHPRSVAAAIPIAGGLPPELEPDRAPPGAPPIRALHGEADPVVPMVPTRDLVQRLDDRGWDATLQPFPLVAHQVPEAVHAALCTQLSAVVQ